MTNEKKPSRDGQATMSGEACAIAIKNILGLVCDPVAGLVEIPCIKRNAGGVTTAFMAAELALAGITSHIPADETILAMKRIGDTMPASLRETAEGGLAMTPTGQALNTRVFGENADAASAHADKGIKALVKIRALSLRFGESALFLSLRLFCKEALQDCCYLRSCCVSLWLQFGVGDAGDQSLGDGPAHGFCGLPSGSSGLAALRFAS